MITRGTLRMAGAAFEAVFGHAGAVTLLRDQRDLMILPVHRLALGGHLVKVCNAAGDRAIDAIELFRTNELADRRTTGTWDADLGALRITDLFR